MKTVFEKVIRRGGYDLGGLLQRIDEYHVEGKLTDGEREELMGMARGGVPGSGVDAAGEDIIGVMAFEDGAKFFRVGEGQPGALIINEATLKVENYITICII